MKQRSPTLEGFRAVFRRPSLVLAEITWRWSIGVAAFALLVFSINEYLHTLPVSPTDLIYLQTRQPPLIYKAIQHIFRGSGPRVLVTVAVMGVALTIAWVIVASISRAATVEALLNYFRRGALSWTSVNNDLTEDTPWRFRSVFGLNFFRAAMTLAAAVACIGSMGLAGSVSTKTNPAPGSVVLVFLLLAMLIWLAWSTLNWFLSVASIFVVSNGQDALGAMEAAADLCRDEFGSVFAAGTWFGLAHLAAFVAATSVVAVPLAFARVLPGSVVLGGVLLVSMLYFAVADFLYAGRLAAYVAIVEMPDAPPKPVFTQPPTLAPAVPPTCGVDPDELILSDLSSSPDFSGV